MFSFVWETRPIECTNADKKIKIRNVSVPNEHCNYNNVCGYMCYAKNINDETECFRFDSIGNPADIGFVG